MLKKALRDIQRGDILLAHLGIWSRKDPWAPAVLEPLIIGLKSRGFCFQTLRERPSTRPGLRRRSAVRRPSLPNRRHGLVGQFFSVVQQWLFEAAVQPALFALGMGNLLEDGYEATAWFMVGVSRSSFCWP